jgi:hypothetical protein
MTRDCPDNPISRQLLSGILWNVFSSGSRQASFKRSSLSLSITILDQARLYTYNAAMLADRNKPITAEAALAKVMVVSRIFRTFDQATASVCTTCG